MDESRVVSHTDSKSISSEQSFEENTNDFEVLRKELLLQAAVDLSEKFRLIGIAVSSFVREQSSSAQSIRSADFLREGD